MIWWLIYDVAAPKRLRSISRLCQCAGMRRIQKSVFAGALTQERIANLRESLLQWVHPEEDRVLIFPVSSRNMDSSISLGIDSGINDLIAHREFLVI